MAIQDELRRTNDDLFDMMNRNKEFLLRNKNLQHNDQYIIAILYAIGQTLFAQSIAIGEILDRLEVINESTDEA